MKTVFLVVLFSIQGFASTFVGNGGTTGDVDVQVALRQIKDTFKLIKKVDDDGDAYLCKCRQSLEGHALCEVVSKLNQEQRKSCHAGLVSQADQVISLLEKKSVKVEFTQDDIEVEEDGGLRVFEAVADSGDLKITIQHQKFMNMQPLTRIYLLTHELLHLTKMNGKYLTDEGNGRAFINSMSAGLAMESFQTGVFKRYNSTLERSPRSSDLWFDIQNHRLAHNGSHELWEIEDNNGGRFGVRYYFLENLGVTAEFWQMNATKDILSSTKLTEDMSGHAVGLTYKQYLGKDIMSFWGHVHLVFDLKLEQYSATYKMNDGLISNSETVTGLAQRLDVRVFFPLQIGFWVFTGAGVSNMNYEYSIVPLNYDKVPLYYTLGVSYGMF